MPPVPSPATAIRASAAQGANSPSDNPQPPGTTPPDRNRTPPPRPRAVAGPAAANRTTRPAPEPPERRARPPKAALFPTSTATTPPARRAATTSHPANLLVRRKSNRARATVKRTKRRITKRPTTTHISRTAILAKHYPKPNPERLQQRPAGHAPFPTAWPASLRASCRRRTSEELERHRRSPAARERTRRAQSHVHQEAGRSGPGTSQESKGQAEVGVAQSPGLDQGGGPEVPRQHAEAQGLGPAARQPGRRRQEGLRRVSENLDLHPKSTELRGGSTTTDNLQNVHDSGQTEAPAEWAELYHAYQQSTAGQK